MKTARFLALFFLCAAAWARADWLQDYEADSREAKQMDLDAVPGKAQVNETPEQAKEEEQKREKIREEEKRAYDEQNWLVQAYQAREDAENKDADASANPDDTGPLKPHDQASESLRNDPSLDTSRPPGSPSAEIKPFLGGESPLPFMPYAAPAPFLPATPALSYNPNPVPTLPTAMEPRIVDTSSLDVPGATAEESGPGQKSAADVGPDDLAPDQTLIPGQNPNDAGQGKPLELQLPVARNMDQLDQLKRDAMNAPQVAGKKNDPNAPQGGVVSVVPAPLPPRGDEDNRVSTPQSMHNHLADPFDILR